MLNMGVMNVVAPSFGGVPMCHGTGGLAGQYYFGARTGGAGILEGLIEIGLGLFLADSIADLLAVFSMSIVGAMMFLVGIELTKFVRHVRGRSGMAVMALTVVASLVTNMAVRFCAGVIAFHFISSPKSSQVPVKDRPRAILPLRGLRCKMTPSCKLATYI